MLKIPRLFSRDHIYNQDTLLFFKRPSKFSRDQKWYQDTLLFFKRHWRLEKASWKVSWTDVLKVYLGEPSWKQTYFFKTVLQDTYLHFQDVISRRWCLEKASWKVSWKHSVLKNFSSVLKDFVHAMSEWVSGWVGEWVCTHTNVYTRISTHTYTACIHEHTYIYTHIHTHIYTAHTRSHTNMYTPHTHPVRVWVWVCECECECVLSLIHISEPTRRRGISYAVFCLKKKNLNQLTWKVKHVSMQH